jgi:O-antigen ligase
MSAAGVTNAPSPVDRVSRVTSSEAAQEGTGGTFYTRLEGYGKAWSRIYEQPLIGVGLDDESSADVLGDESAHNILLNSWLSAGVLGLLGVTVLLCGAFACGIEALRRSSGETRQLVAALLAALVAFAVFAMGEPILFVRYGWFPTALLIAVRAQMLRARTPVVPARLADRAVLAHSSTLR